MGNEMVIDYIHFYGETEKDRKEKRGISIVVYKKYMRNI